MKHKSVALRNYVFAAFAVTIVSFVLYYGLGFGADSAQSLPGNVAFDGDFQESVSNTSNAEGFFSLENPLAWFMFGAWFALLIFFVLSLMNGHARR